MSFDDIIITWARELGLHGEYNDDTERYRFSGEAEVLSFGGLDQQIETEWMTHFEAEEFLQEIEQNLELEVD